MKKILILMLLALAMLAVAACDGGDAVPEIQDAPIQDISVQPPQDSSDYPSWPTVNIGENISFGGIDWLVLDVQEDKKLLISQYILEIRAYHETSEAITWEHSDIRQYLNSEFIYSRFTDAEKEQIYQTTLINNDNPWYGTGAGNDTTDRIFLLSLEEVVRYFGDSGMLDNRPQEHYWKISDEYNARRVAYLHDDVDTTNVFTDLQILPGGSWWWWLRSPGGHTMHGGVAEVAYILQHTTADFSEFDLTEDEKIALLEIWNDEAGFIDVEGILATYPGGVRPALWLYL